MTDALIVFMHQTLAKLKLSCLQLDHVEICNQQFVASG